MEQVGNVMKAYKVAIGLVTFNNQYTELARYAKSLEVTSRRYVKWTGAAEKPELFYVDNGKVSSLKKHFPDARRLKSHGNVGYAAAMGRIISHVFDETAADLIICSNPDGAFHPDSIIELAKFHARFPRDLIEGQQFPEEHPKKHNPTTFITEWGSGCCLLISRNIYNKVGTFDPSFFMYMDDVDYSWRVRLAGRKVRICPPAKYSHLVVNRVESKLTKKYYFESGRYLAYKWGNKTFQKWCELNLIQNGFYKKLSSLPKLSVPEKSVRSRKAKDIANFKNEFRYAESRW